MANNIIQTVLQLVYDKVGAKKNLDKTVNELQKHADKKGIKIPIGVNKTDIASSLDQINKVTNAISRLDHITFENQVAAWKRVNSAAKDYYDTIDEILDKSKLIDDPTVFNGLKKEYNIVITQAKVAGKVGKSLTDTFAANIQKFGDWSFASKPLVKVISEIKDMASHYVNLTDAQLELSKVSNLTADALQNVTEKAYEIGKTVGKTGIQTLNAITEFKRAGFELKSSMEMAEAALMMVNIADGIT